MALTIEQPEVSGKGITASAATVQEVNPLDVISSITEFGLQQREESVIEGATGELTTLRSAQTEDPDIDTVLRSGLQKAEDLVKAEEKELKKLDNNRRVAGMSEKLFKAKAAEILKKYADMAPGLTNEIRNVAVRILGSDPAVDLLRSTFEQPTSKGKSPEEKRYDLYVNSAQQAEEVPVPINEFTEEEFARVNEINKKARDLDILAKQQSTSRYSANQGVSKLASTHGRNFTNTVTGLYQQVVDNPELATDDQKNAMISKLQSLKTFYTEIAQDQFNNSTNITDSYSSLFRRIDDEIKQIEGDSLKNIASNRLAYHSDRAGDEIRSAFGGLGYRYEALMDTFLPPNSAVGFGIGTTAAGLLMQTMNPDNVPGKWEHLFKGQTLPKFLENLKDQVGPEGNTAVNELITESSNHVLHNISNLKQAIRSGDNTKETSDLLDRNKIALVQLVATSDLPDFGLDTDEFQIATNIISEDLASARQELLKTNPKTNVPFYKVELDKGQYKVTAAQLPSLSEQLFTPKTSRTNPRVVSDLNKHINFLGKAAERALGLSKEQVLQIMTKQGTVEERADIAIQVGADPDKVNEAAGEKVTLDKEELKVENPDKDEPEEVVPDGASLITDDIKELSDRFPEATFAEIREFIESRSA